VVSYESVHESVYEGDEMKDFVQAAKYLGIGESSFRLLQKEGGKSEKAKIIKTLEPIELNRKFFFRDEDLQKVKSQLDKIGEKICKNPACKKKFYNLNPISFYCCQKCQKLNKKVINRERNGKVINRERNRAPEAKTRRQNSHQFFGEKISASTFFAPSKYERGEMIVETDYICACGQPANAFTGMCSSCLKKLPTETKARFIPMKGF
jgi:uncharacterized protein YlaI